MKFRKDIQILRGIAVMLVVLFHLGAPGFENAFLGVDIFFVISGYLMARLYDPLHWIEFFKKRALRILPAYLSVVPVVLLASAFVTVSSDYHQVQTQSLFALFFTSNIGFWAENSYFDKSAFKPLLHLWSLGVEIQFYLLVPVVSWITRRAPYALGILFAISLLSCFAVLEVSPKTSFFWLPFRLWEFLIGFAVATFGHNQRTATPASWIGLAFVAAVICISFVPNDAQSLGPVHGHPGLAALLITSATGAVIAFGLPAQAQNIMLSRIFQKIGDYSYSIYLAHFAIIVLLLYRPLSGTIIKPETAKQLVAIVALVVIASVFLHLLVEERGRRLGVYGLLQSWVASLALVLSVAAFGPILQKAMIPRDQRLIYRAWEDRGEYRCGKLTRILHPFARSCEITTKVANPSHRMLLVGNSHADSIKTAFATSAQERNASVYFIVENNPLMPGGMSAEQIIDEAVYRGADVVVLHYSPGAIGAETVASIARLASEKNIRVDFIMPVPTWKADIPLLLIRHSKEGTPLPVQTADDYRHANIALGHALSEISNLTVYRVEDAFCDPDCRIVSSEGRPYYFDHWHLTLTGSAKLKNKFDQLFEDLR